MKKLVLCWVVLLCVSAFVSPSLAALYIDHMSLDVGESYFYDYIDGGTSQFVLSTTIGGSAVTLDQGDINIFGSALDHEYGFTGTITVTASDQVTSGVQGTQPYAIFSSVGTLTLYATELWEKSSGDTIFADTVLLEAQIVALPTAAVPNSWYLMEVANDPDKYNSFDLAYQVTGGAVYDGDIFKLLDFGAAWTLPSTKPENSSFDADLHLENPKMDIFAEVPEPATLMLLGLGGLLLRRKK